MSEIKEGHQQTKSGIIPNDWESVNLRAVLKVSQGLQISISSRFIEPAPNRVNYITIPFLEGKKEEYIEDANASVICQKSDILVVRTGSGVGKIITGAEGAFHNNFFKIKTFDNLNEKYLYYYLTDKKTQFRMRTYAGNSTIPDLNHGDFYSLNFALPPLKEQEEISKILELWDKSILHQKEVIEENEKLKKGLMQKIFTCNIRFCGFDDEWKESKLSEICKIKKGQQLNKLDLIDNGKYPAINDGISPSGYTNEYNTEANTITISEGGNSCGYVNYINTSFWSGGHCYSLLNVKVNVEYLYYYLKYYERNIMTLRVGSGLPNIQKGDIENFKINLPTSLEQEKIVDILLNSDNELKFLKGILVETKEQKKALMQKLLIGEIRV